MRAIPTVSNTTYSGNSNVNSVGVGNISTRSCMPFCVVNGAGNTAFIIQLDTLWATAELT